MGWGLKGKVGFLQAYGFAYIPAGEAVPDNQPKLGHKVFWVELGLVHGKAEHGITMGLVKLHGDIIAHQVVEIDCFVQQFPQCAAVADQLGHGGKQAHFAVVVGKAHKLIIQCFLHCLK